MRAQPSDWQPTVEQEFLLACVRADGSWEAEARRLLSKRGQELDWSALSRTAHDHGVAPFVYARLRTVAPDLVPARELARLSGLYLANARQSLRLTGKLLTIVSLLANRGVEAVAFKGPALAMQAYGDLLLRRFHDLDLLILRQDFRAAYTHLVGAGYTPEYRFDVERGAERLQRSVNELCFYGEGVSLDLHWAIAEEFVTPPATTEQIWRRKESIELSGRQVQAVSAEDMVLVICIHGARHQWQQLGWIVDLAHLVTSRPIDWPGVVGRASKGGNRRILHLGLQLSAGVGGADLPAGLWELFPTDPVVHRLAAQGRYRLFSRATEASKLDSTAFLFECRERLRDRVSLAARRAFTPQPGDWQAGWLPGPLYPLYSLTRPLRVLLEHGPQLVSRWRRRHNC